MPSGTTGWLVGVTMPGNQAQQVVDEDEQKDAGYERLEALVAVADDLVRGAAGELVDHFGDLLRGVGLLDRQRQAHDQEKSRTAPRLPSSSSAKVSLIGVAAASAGCPPRCSRAETPRPEEVIQQARNRKILMHEDEYFLSPDRAMRRTRLRASVLEQSQRFPGHGDHGQTQTAQEALSPNPGNI